MIYIFAVDKEEHLANDIPSNLINEEKIREIRPYNADEDRIRAILSHFLTRYAVKKLYQQDIEELILVFNEFGKASYQDAKFKLNISHSFDIIVLALSENEVGVDIEMIDYERNLSPLLISRVLKDEEVAALEQQPKELSNAFYRAWTRFEAYVKYKGHGLVSFPLEIDTSDAITQSFLIADQKERDYFISVTTSKDEEINVEYLSFDELIELSEK